MTTLARFSNRFVYRAEDLDCRDFHGKQDYALHCSKKRVILIV